MLGKTQMGGVKTEHGLVLIRMLAMPSRPGTAGQIMSALGQQGLNVEFIAQVMGVSGNDNVALCVKKEAADNAMAVLKALEGIVQAQTIARQDGVGLVFTFGPEFRNMPGTAGQIFELLGQTGINIIAISTSMAAVTCVIDDADIDNAEVALKAVFATP